MKPFILLLCGAFFLSAFSISQEKKSIKKGKTPVDSTKGSHGLVVIQTSMGDITIQLADDKAPKHAANFRKLAKEGFYAGTTFHRVIPGFMIQGGDPNSKGDDRSKDGLGGPGYTIDAEIGLTHERGVIAAARQGDEVNPARKSNGSQFYITAAPAQFLDGQYSVFGKVVKGMEVVDKIVAVPRDRNDNPLQKVLIKKVSVH
jgi:cyclophilin family peptidyl-prolyl cis-trans isomerase